MKTLYVSDLDGTLLTSQVQVAPYTRSVLGEMYRQQIPFTIATARSNASVCQLLAGIPMALPVILLNGTFTYDLQRQRFCQVVPLGAELAQEVLARFARHGLPTFLFSYREQALTMSYRPLDRPTGYEGRSPRPLEEYPHLAPGALPQGEVVFLNLLDREEHLRPLYEDLLQLPGLHMTFYADPYFVGYWFLEICSSQATKSRRIQELQETIHAQRLVVFGDGPNDLDMFRLADEAYAPANAREELLCLATQVLGHHDREPVAKFLHQQVLGGVPLGQ